MKVLVVVEDPTLDQYIVKPLIESLLTDLGKGFARVEVLRDPHLRGVDDLLAELDAIVDDYPMIDLFVVIIDRDCDRQGHVAKLERKASRHSEMLTCIAHQEVEVWMLAVQDETPKPWADVRRACDPKEQYAEPWLASQGYDRRDVGQGRKAAMAAIAGGGYQRVLQRCPEVRALRDSLAAHLKH